MAEVALSLLMSYVTDQVMFLHLVRRVGRCFDVVNARLLALGSSAARRAGKCFCDNISPTPKSRTGVLQFREVRARRGANNL